MKKCLDEPLNYPLYVDSRSRSRSPLKSNAICKREASIYCDPCVPTIRTQFALLAGLFSCISETLQRTVNAVTRPLISETTTQFNRPLRPVVVRFSISGCIYMILSSARAC